MTTVQKAVVSLSGAVLLLLVGCGPADDTGPSASASAASPGATVSPSGGGSASTSESSPAASATGALFKYRGVTVTGDKAMTPVITLAAGFPEIKRLRTPDIYVGKGQPAVDHADIEVNYVGVVASTGEVFETTFDGGKVQVSSIDDHIVGWTEGLLGMQAGGRRLLLVPAALGYGPVGNPPLVGPNEDLIFVVDMLKVTAPAE